MFRFLWDYPTPGNNRLYQSLNEYKLALVGLRGSNSRIRLPITIQILTRIHQALVSSNHPERTVIWAIACSAFFEFFRVGKLLPSSARNFNPATSLCWGDVAVDNHLDPTMIQVHLRVAKCDQFGKGSDIILGRTSLTICPVSALELHREKIRCPRAIFCEFLQGYHYQALVC